MHDIFGTVDDRDTFETRSYKNYGYIHTCHNRTTGKLEVKSQINYEVKQHRTIEGAKRYITAEKKRRGALSDACQESRCKIVGRFVR